MSFDKKEILIIGGTGTLGKTLTRLIVKQNPKGIRIFSRDELKQSQMKRRFADEKNISFLIGDVRDINRLNLAMRGVDIVINCAAMKHVDVCEYNPIEAVNTNIDGAKNIIQAAIEQNVFRVMHISTDKAVYPVNLYGATKTVAEKLMVQANVYGASRRPIFSVCRYGNVLGSRGSVVDLFKKQYKESGRVSITDKNMTRFWIGIEDAANFILESINNMEGGEIFIPKMGSLNIVDTAGLIVDDENIQFDEIGIRPGEKLHECMITNEESFFAFEHDNSYIIRSPLFCQLLHSDGVSWEWTSRNNHRKTTKEEIGKFMEQVE